MRILYRVMQTVCILTVLQGILLIAGIFPQPEHIASLEGTFAGAFRDTPNPVVGFIAILAGLLSLAVMEILGARYIYPKSSGAYPRAPQVDSGPRLVH